jgi:hypothetical protein
MGASKQAWCAAGEDRQVGDDRHALEQLRQGGSAS